MTVTNTPMIHPGDVVIYTGSLTEAHGPAVYRGFCYCDHCDNELRFVLILADGTPLEHARRASFGLPTGAVQASDDLSGISYAIREHQAELDAMTARSNAGRLPHQRFSLNDSILA